MTQSISGEAGEKAMTSTEQAIPERVQAMFLDGESMNRVINWVTDYVPRFCALSDPTPTVGVSIDPEDGRLILVNGGVRESAHLGGYVVRTGLWSFAWWDKDRFERTYARPHLETMHPLGWLRIIKDEAA